MLLQSEYVMLRKHWRTGVTRKRVLMTLGSSALVTWDWDTGSNRAHYITNKIYCLAETVWSLPGEKSWVFITACVDSECFLITLLLLWRVKCKRLPPLPGLITPSSRVSSQIHDTNNQLCTIHCSSSCFSVFQYCPAWWLLCGFWVVPPISLTRSFKEQFSQLVFQ